MRLVYTTTGKPVNIGDRHTVGGFALVVAHMPKPHKPDSEGKIDFHVEGEERGPAYYCSVIGAEWIEREDRADVVTFNDGMFCVIVNRHMVALGRRDAAIIRVPRGHAWFDRVAEANDRRTIEDLYDELAAALA